MLDKKIKEELELGFYNELHADPFCLDIWIKGYNLKNMTDIILKSWEPYDQYNFKAVYNKLVKKFEEEYGINKDKIIECKMTTYAFEVIYQVNNNSLERLACLFRMKGISDKLY